MVSHIEGQQTIQQAKLLLQKLDQAAQCSPLGNGQAVSTSTGPAAPSLPQQMEMDEDVAEDLAQELVTKVADQINKEEVGARSVKVQVVKVAVKGKKFEVNDYVLVVVRCPLVYASGEDWGSFQAWPFRLALRRLYA